MVFPVTDRIFLVKGDITEQRVDAIVNAANPSLMGGGGVDGAIHRAAGPELDVECRMLGGCATGDAVMTKGYRLPARFVIHTVGPVWGGDADREDELLASCYVKVLEHAQSHDLQTVAFPAISTGAYGFPLDRATRIAVRTVANFLRDRGREVKVTFVCHGNEAFRVYTDTLNDPALAESGNPPPAAPDPGRKAADTPGDIREQVAGQLLVIEAAYGIRIVNKDRVIDKIAKTSASRERASYAAAALNGWIASKEISGRTEIPDDVLMQILARTAA